MPIAREKKGNRQYVHRFQKNAQEFRRIIMHAYRAKKYLGQFSTRNNVQMDNHANLDNNFRK